MASVEADDWRVGLSLLQRQQYILDGQYRNDVTFLVGMGDQKKVIKAHKFPLIAGSAVLESFIDRWTAESSEAIVITDTEPSTFMSMQRFLYSEATEITGDNVMPLLHLSKIYLISHLTKLCVEFLQKQISIDNVCAILDGAIQYNDAELSRTCAEFACRNALTVVKSKGFMNMCNQSLVEILKCNESSGVSEVEIYRACMEWADGQCRRQGQVVEDKARREALGEAIHLIRFPKMSIREFAVITSNSQLLTGSEKAGVYEHLALHGHLSQCNCALKFCLEPRESVPAVTISRFSPSGVLHGWRSSGEIQAIDFVCNSRAILKGVGLYTENVGNTHTVTVQLIHQPNQLKGSIQSHLSPTMKKTSPVLVNFPKEIPVTAGMKYTITATFKGSHCSYYGEQGNATVNSGSFTVTFFDSTPNQLGNTTKRGQIPELYFVL